MLLFTGLLDLLRIAVHSFADEQVRAGRMLSDGVRRTAVRAVGTFQTLPIFAHHHVAGVFLPLVSHGLPLLQGVPQLHRKSQRLCGLNIKPPAPGQLDAVAITDDVVIYLKGRDLQSYQIQDFLLLRQLYKLNGEGKLRRYNAQAVHHPLDSRGSHDSERLGTFRISHGQEKSRQSADMIRMKMCHQQNVNGLKTPSLSANRELRRFPAVDHHRTSVISHHKGGKGPVGKRHHSAAPE